MELREAVEVVDKMNLGDLDSNGNAAIQIDEAEQDAIITLLVAGKKLADLRDVL